MPTTHEMAAVARAWLKEHRVHQYRMKKISEMDDREVLQKCHWWNEEHQLTREFTRFEREQLYSKSKETEDKS